MTFNELAQLLGVGAVYYILMMLSIAFHEVGHLIGYKMFGGGKDWHILIGTGKRILRMPKISLGIIPCGGHCAYPENSILLKHQAFTTYIGGPLGTTVVMFLLVMVWRNAALVEVINLSKFLFYYNMYMLLFTIVPMPYPFLRPRIYSDGWYLVKLLIGK